MNEHLPIAVRHLELTRRYLFRAGLAGAAGLTLAPSWAREPDADQRLAEAIAKLEFLTRIDNFGTVERGNPLPYTLPIEKRREVGLEPETWRLEVLPDPDSDTKLEQPLAKELGTALDWQTLMQLAAKHSVRYLKTMTCNNIGEPLGTGLWEGVPLREVIWLTRPIENLRRVFYYGYHNDDPKQLFQSSLPIGRVLEDPPGYLPVLLCYKLNGQLLPGKRGGPVRMLVPEAYGFKSVKWLQRVVLTNHYQANDTYASGNNDIDSWMKTFARFVSPPGKVKAGSPIAITGMAQVGISGLSKVQVCVHRQDAVPPPDDPFLAQSPWKDAEILAPPKRWGPDLPECRLPELPRQFDPATGQPREWPIRYALAHWAILLHDLSPGNHFLHCRTIDANGIAQPMPRPFLKSGRNAIQRVPLAVEA